MNLVEKKNLLEALSVIQADPDEWNQALEDLKSSIQESTNVGELNQLTKFDSLPRLPEEIRRLAFEQLIAINETSTEILLAYASHLFLYEPDWTEEYKLAEQIYESLAKNYFLSLNTKDTSSSPQP